MASSHCSLVQSLRLRTLPVPERSKAEVKLTATTQDKNGKKKHIGKGKWFEGIIPFQLALSLSYWAHCFCDKNLWRIAKLICPDWKTLQSLKWVLPVFNWMGIHSNSGNVRQLVSNVSHFNTSHDTPGTYSISHDRKAENHLPNNAMASSWTWRPWQSSSNLGSGTRTKVRILPWKCQISWLCHICYICHDGNMIDQSQCCLYWEWTRMDCNWWLMLLIKWLKLVQGELLMFFANLPSWNIRSFTTRVRAAKISDAWMICLPINTDLVCTILIWICAVSCVCINTCVYIYIHNMISLYTPVAFSLDSKGLDSKNHEGQDSCSLPPRHMGTKSCVWWSTRSTCPRYSPKQRPNLSKPPLSVVALKNQWSTSMGVSKNRGMVPPKSSICS